MSRVRLYVDEDAVHSVVVEGLMRAGIDVLTAVQSGRRGASDEDHLRFASADGRAIYSLNASDFSRLHSEVLASGGTHCGILVFTSQRYGPGEKLRRIIEHLETVTAESMIDQMHFL